MSAPLLFLFDDARARSWRPFTATRPAGELRYGAMTLRERAEPAVGVACEGYLAAPHLARYHEPWAPRVHDPGAVPRDRDVVYLSSRMLLDGLLELPDGPATWTVDGEPCGWYAPAGVDRPGPQAILDPAAGPDWPAVEVAGTMLGQVWELMAGNTDRLDQDLHEELGDRSPPVLPDGVHALGSGPMMFGRDVAIEPGVVLDATSGPIWIEDRTTVRAFTRVAGPAHVGPDCTLLGGSFTGVSIGPVCKVRGEVEETVIVGYSNKAHDGFLGHAYLGCWVNLGALTTNSDLKNNYGTVRVWTPEGEVDTGLRKVGCLIGDHVKTAIGTMLGTGTVLEAGSNIFAGAPPGYVPPFAWGDGGPASYDVERFLETAAVVMGRRDIALSDDQAAMLRGVWQRARHEAEG